MARPVVRPLRPEDVPVLVRLMAGAVRQEGPSAYGAAHVAAWARSAGRLPERIGEADTCLVFADPDVVAFAVRKDDLVAYLYVAPGAMRRGIGRLLLQALEADARAAGVGSLHLNSSRNAVAFYEHCGYRQHAPVHVRGPGGLWFERVPMSRDL